MQKTTADIGNKWLVLIVSVFGAFMIPFDSSVVNVAIPSIGTEFGGELALLTWIPLATLLSLTSLVLVFGRLADLKGRRLLYSAGLIIFSSASVICALSTSIYQLIVSRAVLGIGAAMISGNSIAFITSAFPPHERGRALGIQTTAVYTGASLGPTLGGFLISILGWRWVFCINVPLGAIVVTLLLLKVGEPIHAKSHGSLDLLGTFTFTGAVGTAIVAGTLSQSTLIQPSSVLILGLIGAIMMTAFVYVESRIATFPILDLRLFTHNRMFACSNFTALLNYQAVYGITFLMSLYLQIVRQLSPQEAGLILLSQPILMTLISPISGWISDFVQPRVLVSSGMTMISAATFLLSRLTVETPLLHVVYIMILLGAGYGLFSSPNTNAVMGSVGKESFGVAAGTLATMRFVGQSFSLAIVTSVLLRFIPSGKLIIGSGTINVPMNQFLLGLSAAFIVLSAISAVGALISLVRGPQQT